MHITMLSSFVTCNHDMSTVNVAAIEELIVYPATSLKNKTSLGK